MTSIQVHFSGLQSLKKVSNIIDRTKVNFNSSGLKSWAINKKNSFLLYIYLFLVIVTTSCNSKTESKSKENPIDPEELIAINKAMVNDEQEQIEDYIIRYQYKMVTTPTGLHYLLLDSGQGRSPVFKSVVSLKYKVEFLNGNYCYSSDSSGVLQFSIGQSDEPTGLQEGLLKLKEGGKAIYIVPSYLAYGLTGDGNKIGNNQTLVYHVTLLKVE